MAQENSPGSAQVDVTVVGASLPGSEAILTAEALAFVAELHVKFNPRRLELLSARAARQTRMDAGEVPDFWRKQMASVQANGKWPIRPPICSGVGQKSPGRSTARW